MGTPSRQLPSRVGLERIRRSRLHLVTDRRLCQGDLVEAVEAAVRGGVDVVQLRERDLATRELFDLASRLRTAIGSSAALIINDRLDVALAVGADGVQLGGRSLPVGVARETFGRNLALGVSVHSVEEAVQAERDGAGYLILGTIFPSRSHPGEPGGGIGLVREVVAKVSIPVFAIGGIGAANIAEVVAAGACGAAVISAILAEPDPEVAARSLMHAIGNQLEESCRPLPIGDPNPRIADC